MDRQPSRLAVKTSVGTGKDQMPQVPGLDLHLHLHLHAFRLHVPDHSTILPRVTRTPRLSNLVSLHCTISYSRTLVPNAAATTTIHNGNGRPFLPVPAPYRPQTTITQTPPTPPHNHDPFILSSESFFKKQNAAALLHSVAGPATPPQNDSPFQSRMAQPPSQQPNRSQSSTPPLPWQNIPAEYRPAYWPEDELAPPPPNRLLHPATHPPATSSSLPTSAPRHIPITVPQVNEPRHHHTKSLSAFQLQQQQFLQEQPPPPPPPPQQPQPQPHLLNPHYASLADVKKPLSIQSRRPRRLRSMLRLAPDPASDLRTRIVHPHFDPAAPVEIIPPRSAPPQLSAAPWVHRSQSQPGTPSWANPPAVAVAAATARARAASGGSGGPGGVEGGVAGVGGVGGMEGRHDPNRISPAQPPVRASSMRERGWDEGWEVHEQEQHALREVEMGEAEEEEGEVEVAGEVEDEDEDAFELALFAEATSGMGPLGVVDWSGAAAGAAATESPSHGRGGRRRSSRQPVSPISPPMSREESRVGLGIERGLGRGGRNSNQSRAREWVRDQERERERERERESRQRHHQRNPSNTSLSPSVVSGIIPTRRSWDTFMEPEANFAASGPGREAQVVADELPTYGQSQLEATQKNRQESARRAAELQRRWEESYRHRA
ncbi:hypothetical protein EV356DRAFT_552945 [Viridothelium virens]|uniref:Uncharacterized protein n=1 Tax=Viridothelium virens TaxID=1048519 RepID=A0A6A6GYW8_VIRVR|nr:hypothetical protein EV356DRAFT_552945 [Viridothelium virens]